MTSHNQIDLSKIPANLPVLCIPRVYANIKEARIRKIFDELDMGTIQRIDIITKHSISKPHDKGEKFNRVFVHYSQWNDSENAQIARERLLNGMEIKVIYDDPWFWKISAYRETTRRPYTPKPSESNSINNQYSRQNKEIQNTSYLSKCRRNIHNDTTTTDTTTTDTTTTDKQQNIKIYELRSPSSSPPRERN